MTYRHSLWTLKPAQFVLWWSVIHMWNIGREYEMIATTNQAITLTIHSFIHLSMYVCINHSCRLYLSWCSKCSKCSAVIQTNDEVHPIVSRCSTNSIYSDSHTKSNVYFPCIYVFVYWFQGGRILSNLSRTKTNESVHLYTSQSCKKERFNISLPLFRWKSAHLYEDQNLNPFRFGSQN